MGRRWFGRGHQIDKLNIRFFSSESLRNATKNYSTLIGSGGFGQVYKGILPNKRKVAIKKVKRSSTPEQEHENDFFHVINFMSHIHHRNILQVIGCCTENDYRIVVHEYAENGSVSDILGDLDKKQSIFNWERRAAVSIGTARDLSYLHEDVNPRIIHCDIKASNILLDGNFNPKIADFDLVGFVYHDHELPREGPILGTVGYLAPEYIETSKYTEKVDVYSFGVLMLEIISGRKVVESTCDVGRLYLLDWVSTLQESNRMLEIVDPVLIDFPESEVQHFVDVAILCIQGDPNQRPSMFEVLHMLCGGSHSCKVSLRKLVASSDQRSGSQSVNLVPQTALPSAKSVVRADDDSYNRLAIRRFEVEQNQIAADSSMKSKLITSSGQHTKAKLMSHTIEIKKHSHRFFMEAVYPPFLTGVYRRSASTSLVCAPNFSGYTRGQRS